jgi:hypothetical protein
VFLFAVAVPVGTPCDLAHSKTAKQNSPKSHLYVVDRFAAGIGAKRAHWSVTGTPWSTMWGVERKTLAACPHTVTCIVSRFLATCPGSVALAPPKERELPTGGPSSPSPTDSSGVPPHEESDRASFRQTAMARLGGGPPIDDSLQRSLNMSNAALSAKQRSAQRHALAAASLGFQKGVAAAHAAVTQQARLLVGPLSSSERARLVCVL